MPELTEVERETLSRPLRGVRGLGTDGFAPGPNGIVDVVAPAVERIVAARLAPIEALTIECSYHGGGDPSPKCEGCATASEARADLLAAIKGNA